MIAPSTGTFGAATWPGLVKIMEEAGEVQRAAAKLLQFPEGFYPDGTDLVAQLIEELGDLGAALDVFGELNLSPDLQEAVDARALAKRTKFLDWHQQEVDRA